MRGMPRRSGFGWGQFIIGVCLILLGFFTFLRPSTIFTGMAVIYGIMAVITGISDIIFYIKEARFTGIGPGIALVSGILSMMTGITLLAYPGMGSWLVNILFPFWFITHCISRLTHLNLIRFTAGSFYYWFTLIVNILGVVFGFMMLFMPFITYFTAGYFIAFYLIVFGIDCIVMSFTNMGSRW